MLVTVYGFFMGSMIDNLGVLKLFFSSMPVTSNLFSRSKGAASPQNTLAQACIPTEHGPRIFASGGRSSLEEVVLEAPWKRLATLGPCYGTPSSFIYSDSLSFFLSFFLSFLI